VFSLKHIQSGTLESFDIQVLLELLGDPINDEIQLGEHRYRISSFQPLSGELTSGTPCAENCNSSSLVIAIPVIGASVFSLEGRQVDISTLMLTVNNVLYKYEVDYTISSGSLIWQGQFDLEPSDSLWLRYREIV
jgi:hypothetical protein